MCKSSMKVIARLCIKSLEKVMEIPCVNINSINHTYSKSIMRIYKICKQLEILERIKQLMIEIAEKRLKLMR